MRAPSSLFAAIALVLVACAGADPAPSPPPPSTAPPLAPTPSAAPTAAVAPTATATAAVAPTATATAVAEPPRPASPCPPAMALVPGGTFTMSRPKREVTVAPLCMDVNETTADEYAVCVKAGKCTDTNLEKCSPQATYKAPGKGNHPLTCSDFSQAVAYCAAQNKRLASDEEWEWAARGGAAGTTFPWGNDKPNGKACWSGETPLVGTCPVGATPAGDSPQGIHDLAGNVYEWTTSRNDKAGPMRVGRGGSWRESAPEGLKVSRPGPGFLVTYRCGFLGIRCAVEPQKPAATP